MDVRVKMENRVMVRQVKRMPRGEWRLAEGGGGNRMIVY